MINEIKIKVIKKDTPEELALAIEVESKKINIFASPIFFDYKNDEWVSFLYYRILSQVTKPLEKPFAKSKTDSQSKPLNEDKKPDFIPSKNLLEKWKKIKPTYKTLELLKKKGFNEIELKEVKSQYDCYVILENLKKKNI